MSGFTLHESHRPRNQAVLLSEDVWLGMPWPSALTDRYPAAIVEWRDGSTLGLTSDTLPDTMRVIVLQQSR